MATKQSTSFTVRETELLTIAFQCLKERPNVRRTYTTYVAFLFTDCCTQIDYEVMASKANYKGAKSARDSFNQLYNKIVSGEKSSSFNGEAKEQSDEPSPKKMTPSKRKAGMLSLRLSMSSC